MTSSIWMFEGSLITIGSGHTTSKTKSEKSKSRFILDSTFPRPGILIFHQCGEILFEVRSILVVVFIKLPGEGEGKDNFEASTVLVSSLRILGTVGVGGVPDVEVYRVVGITPGSAPVIIKVTDDESLIIADIDGARDLVLERAEVPNKRV